jgi:hypothetical protein
LVPDHLGIDSIRIRFLFQGTTDNDAADTCWATNPLHTKRCQPATVENAGKGLAKCIHDKLTSAGNPKAAMRFKQAVTGKFAPTNAEVASGEDEKLKEIRIKLIQRERGINS